MKQTIQNIIQLGIKELFGLGRDKLLLGLILYLLYRESRDEEFLIMLAAMLLG